MTAPLQVDVFCWSDDARLQQIYTGLTALRRSGRIVSRQHLLKHPSEAGLPMLQPGSGHLKIQINGNRTLLFDVTDQGSMMPGIADAVDCVFKRSYNATESYHCTSSGTNVEPLGLNYPVYPNLPDLHGLQRAFLTSGPRRWLAQAIRLLDVAGWISHLPRERQLEDIPRPDVEPRVLFQVRAWDPEEFPGCTPERIRHFTEVNDMRAACIRALRSTFGERFTGGFSHTAFARKRYGDALSPAPELTAKRNYLRLLRHHPICIATGGLHGSIGWKVGEFVALSKAIVMERHHHILPGHFAEGQHHLGFDTPEECVQATLRLMDDDSLRGAMMGRNHAYFLEHLRPETVVFRALSHPASYIPI